MAFVGSGKTVAPWNGPTPPKPKRPFWLWRSVRESLAQSLQRMRSLRAWWGHWRRTAACQTVVGFVVIYGLLAFIRQPSELVIERSRHAQEIAFLQDFLKSYCAAGGALFTDRPHGGSELYPRGIVMQGELRAAFNRAAPGTLFVTTVNSLAANPLSGFNRFPPVYAGGRYFTLDARVNVAAYRCTLLIRKTATKRAPSC